MWDPNGAHPQRGVPGPLGVGRRGADDRCFAPWLGTGNCGADLWVLIDHHPHARKMLQRQELRAGERCLFGTAAPEQDDFAHLAGAQGLQGMIGDVGAGKIFRVG